MSGIWDFSFSVLGLGILWSRLWARDPRPTKISQSTEMVSIVVPCRNEAGNVEKILSTLTDLGAIRYEVLIVDDESTDATVDKATPFQTRFPDRVRILRAPPKPAGWVGKSWACWHGAQSAKGEILLFTDADTRHGPDSLRTALGYMVENDVGLISAPPYHLCERWWEKCLGLFHLLPLIATRFSSLGPHRDPTGRLFAIGQYLLFRKSAYFACGGHAGVKDSLAEDIDLARAVITSGGGYAIYPRTDLYGVQMYSSLAEFISGWTRLMRVGLPRVSVYAVLEIVIVFHLFIYPSTPMILALAFLIMIQKRHGNFSAWGAALAPVSLLLFCALTLRSQIDRALKKGIAWHDRIYPV